MMGESSEESFTLEELKEAYKESGLGPELVERRPNASIRRESPCELEGCDETDAHSILQPIISPEVGKRKRKLDHTKWQAEIQKKKRLSGEAYTGFQTFKSQNSVKKVFGKPKSARVMKPACTSSSCRRSTLRNCEMFTELDRMAIFNQFWKELDWDQKRVFVISSTEKVPKKESRSTHEFSKRSETFFYYLPRSGQKQKVCQKMFLNTLGLGHNQVFRWIKDKRVTRKPYVSSTSTERDGTKWAKVFLNGLPKMESHYCRKETSKLYLEPVFDTKSQVHRVYKEYCQSNEYPVVSRKKFLSVISDMNIGIFQPKKDRCDICCSYESGNTTLEAWRAHISKKDEARSAKEKDKEDALIGLCHAIAVDVQAVKLAPMVSASAMYYKTKLMVHNYSIYDMKTHAARCYWWHEAEGDLVASVFASSLIQFLEEKFNDELPIIIWSDGCTNQNRNKILSNALLNYAKRSKKIVMQKYLEKGHTQMEVDTVHSVIEKALKKKPIYHPLDYVTTTRTARKSGSPYEAILMDHSKFIDYSKPETMQYADIRPGNKTGDPCVTDLRELRYNPTGFIEYKLNHSSDWLKHPKKSRNVKNEGFAKLYKQRLPISKRKYDDLQELMSVIPSRFHDFYKNLPK